jgi:hypothetical protein
MARSVTPNPVGGASDFKSEAEVGHLPARTRVSRRETLHGIQWCFVPAPHRRRVLPCAVRLEHPDSTRQTGRATERGSRHGVRLCSRWRG